MGSKIYKHRASQGGLLLTNGKDELGLGASLITYLKKDYAEQKSGVKDEVFSKYFEKGIQCEMEAIDICAERFGLGMLEKNNKYFSDDYFKGTPDAITEEYVIDTKCSWDYSSFLDSVTNPINKDYECQLQIYMHLLGLKKARLVYVLLDTPDFINYGNEIIFSHLPIEERFFYFDIDYDLVLIEKMKRKIDNCRIFINQYDEKVKSLLKLNK
jgi:hypothetical protein